jgi:hypothetical protein
MLVIILEQVIPVNRALSDIFNLYLDSRAIIVISAITYAQHQSQVQRQVVPATIVNAQRDNIILSARMHATIVQRVQHQQQDRIAVTQLLELLLHPL